MQVFVWLGLKFLHAARATEDIGVPVMLASVWRGRWIDRHATDQVLDCLAALIVMNMRIRALIIRATQVLCRLSAELL
jgi:hypothetical protein